MSSRYPPASSRSRSAGSRPALKKITIVAPWAAKEAISSRSGTGVRPAIRVMTTDWETPGSVYSTPSAAAAPLKALTPGVTS